MTHPTGPLVPGRPDQSCTRCVMSTAADPDIRFDAAGICQHCLRYDALVGTRVVRGPEGARALEALVSRIKAQGKGKEYDCIVGVSGGVDSTYTAWLVREQGLRPLAVHFDNGWNSELAVKNIEVVLRGLGIDLHTYVVDWEEFRDLQLAFLRASTPDGEIPTDHAIQALLWRSAVQFGVKYVISGMNFTTESISVPAWAYGHSDWRYIKDVHRRHGTTPIRTYPHYSLPYLAYVNGIRGVRTVSFLNYLEYDKAKALAVLTEKLGWRKYAGKHHESIYTRFFQGYILPRKFGIDKRVGHLSDLINAGQLTREAALTELQRPPYPVEDQERDREYVIGKFGITPAEFDALLAAPRRSFRDYRNNYAMVQRLRGAVNRLRGAGLYPK